MLNIVSLTKSLSGRVFRSNGSKIFLPFKYPLIILIYHMMLLVMSAHKENKKLSVEELKTKLFKTSRPKSALIITEACEKGFFRLEKTSTDQRIKNIIPSESFIQEFNEYLNTLKNISY